MTTNRGLQVDLNPKHFFPNGKRVSPRNPQGSRLDQSDDNQLRVEGLGVEGLVFRVQGPKLGQGLGGMLYAEHVRSMTAQPSTLLFTWCHGDLLVNRP